MMSSYDFDGDPGPDRIVAVCMSCLPHYREDRIYHVARVRMLPECRAAGHEVVDQPTPATSEQESDARREMAEEDFDRS